MAEGGDGRGGARIRRLRRSLGGGPSVRNAVRRYSTVDELAHLLQNSPQIPID